MDDDANRLTLSQQRFNTPVPAHKQSRDEAYNHKNNNNRLLSATLREGKPSYITCKHFVVFREEAMHLSRPWQCKQIGTLCAALEGHLFCAECAATITERSTQPLSGRAVEISLSVSCPSSDYLARISRVVKCFTYDLMRDVLLCIVATPPPSRLHKMFTNFWKVTSIKASWVLLCCGNVQQTSAENPGQVH